MIPPDDVRRFFAEYFGFEPDAIPMGWTSMMDELAVAMEEMTKGIRDYLPAGPEVRGLLEGGDGGVMGLLGWDAPTEQELDVEPEGAAPEQADVPIGLARHVAAGMSAEDASHLAEMMRTPAQPREESQPEPTPEPTPVEQEPAQPKSEWEERDDLDADLEEPFDPNETEGAWRPRESGGVGMENANGEVAYDWKEEDGLLVAEEDGEIISGGRENFQDEADEALGNITEALPSVEGNVVYLQAGTLEPGKAPTKLVVFGESAQTIAGALDAANVSYRDNFDSIEEKMEEGKETRDGDPYDESHFKLTISGKKNVQAAIQALVGDNGDYGVLVLQDESGSLRFMLNPKSVDMEGVTTLAQAQAANEQLKQGIEERNRQAIAAWEARTGLKYDPEWREHIVRPDGPFREVDGNTIREGTIRNGEWDGEVREYRDGVLRKTAIYKNGSETGTRKLYRGDGTLALDRFFNEDGNAVEIHYGKDGKTEEYRLVRGKRGVVLFDSRNQPQEAPAEPATHPEPEQKPSAKTKAFERVREPVGEHGAYMEGIKENGHWVGEVKHFPAANDKLPAMIEHYDGLGRLERIQTMYSTDRSKVYTETFYYADGTSLQAMFAPNGDRVRSVSIDVNGRETILYSRAQERLRRRIEEAKDNKYFPKESIDWELLMSDKDGMQLADDLMFYIEDRKRQDEELPSLDKKQNENARKRAQAKLLEAKKKALAKQEELQKWRGQAGNTALSVGEPKRGDTIVRRTTFDVEDDEGRNVGFRYYVSGTAIAAASLLIDDKSTYVERLDVDDKYQNMGFGTRILKQLADEYGDVYVAPDNEDAKRLYERIGYDEVGSRAYNESYYAVDEGYGVYSISGDSDTNIVIEGEDDGAGNVALSVGEDGTKGVDPGRVKSGLSDFAKEWKSRGGLEYGDERELNAILDGANRFMDAYFGGAIALSNGGVLRFYPDRRAIERLGLERAWMEYAIHAVTHQKGEGERVRVYSRTKAKTLDDIREIVAADKCVIDKGDLVFIGNNGMSVVAEIVNEDAMRFDEERYITTKFTGSRLRRMAAVPLNTLMAPREGTVKSAGMSPSFTSTVANPGGNVKPGNTALSVGGFGLSAEEDAAYLDAVRRGDTEAARRMVEERARKMGVENPIPEQTDAYKVRVSAPPKKTIKVYKVFTIDQAGRPTALFVSGMDALPMGVWLDAQDTWHFTAKNGKQYVPSTANPNGRGGKTGAAVEIPNEATRQELIKRGFLPQGSKAKTVVALAYRPGWHAGDMPFFPQGGVRRAGSNYGNVHHARQVVFECEMDADHDYTDEARRQPKALTKDGRVNEANADLQSMPEGGFYRYSTNPLTKGGKRGTWFISGSLKINRALTQGEADGILRENGFAPQEWEQGELDLAQLGYRGDESEAARKTLAPVTYDDDGKVIPLSQRFNPENPDIRLSVGSRMGGRAPVVEPGGDVREAGEGALAWLRRKFVHSQTPVFDAVRRVMGVGREPPDALNVEAAAKNVHGKIRARQEMLQRAYLEPLKAILAQPGLDRKRFDDYALALHALERNRMIQERSVVVDPTTGEVVDLGVEAGSGVTNAWAERVIREIQRDPFAEQYKEAANILAEMNRFVLRGAVPESHKHAKIKMTDPQYVPKGSTAEALLRERGIRLVETEDKGGYWVDTGVLPNALKRVVRESVPQGDDIVTFWENGERKFIRFEGKRGRDGRAENEAARIADALNFKNVLHKEGKFWDAIRGLTRWKANVSTSWNPTFIVRNMGADVFNTANLMMIEGKYAELARTMRNYPAALNRVERSSHAWVSFTDGVFPLAEVA